MLIDLVHFMLLHGTRNTSKLNCPDPVDLFRTGLCPSCQAWAQLPFPLVTRHSYSSNHTSGIIASNYRHNIVFNLCLLIVCVRVIVSFRRNYRLLLYIAGQDILLELPWSD